MDLEWINNPWLVAVNLLAAFRITRLVVTDAFPLGVLRGRVIDWAQEHWRPGKAFHNLGAESMTDRERRQFHAYDGDAPLAYLVTCPWCVGPYVSVLVAVLASTGVWWLYPAGVLAASAVIGLLATLTD